MTTNIDQFTEAHGIQSSGAPPTLQARTNQIKEVPTIAGRKPGGQGGLKFSHKLIKRVGTFELSTAQTTPIIIPITGTSIEIDSASTGYVSIALNNVQETPRSMMPGQFFRGNDFDKLFITWPAQASGVCIVNCWQDSPGDEMVIG